MTEFRRSDSEADETFAAWAAEPLAPLEPLSPPYQATTRSWASEWIPESMRAELDAGPHDEPQIRRPVPRA